MANMKTGFFIIGSGLLSSVSNKLNDEAKKVMVIDKLFEGNCALHGFTPKKAM